MLICKDCTIRHNWFGMRHGDGDCELCWDRNTVVFEVTPKKIETPVNPVLDTQHPLTETATLFQEAGKAIDKGESWWYNNQCENLFIHFRKGVRAGQIDYHTTDRFLKSINVIVNGVQDWKATYKRRLKAKQSYQLAEERIGG